MISFICAIPQEPDDKAFMLSLYDSYYKLMYSIAYKYVSDIQTVDDACHSCFCRIADTSHERDEPSC